MRDVQLLSPPSGPAASQGQLPLWDEAPAELPVMLRHSRRARRVAVRIRAGGEVELVVPRGMSERHAWAFLHSRAEWVRHHVARRRANLPAAEPFPPRLLNLPLLGERWRVFQSGGRTRPRVLAQCGPPANANGPREGMLELRGQGTGEQWRRALLSWLKSRAIGELGARVGELAALHGFTHGAVRVRLQRSRWGSCSTAGTLSLNLALLFQPEDVVRYLLIHELSHTRHMNHSRRFWNCVAACEPRWRELDRALLQGWRNVPAWLTART